MIHRSAIQHFVKSKIPCSIRYVDKGGLIIEFSGVLITSEDYRRRTINVKIISSGEVRKLRTICITHFNGETVIY